MRRRRHGGSARRWVATHDARRDVLYQLFFGGGEGREIAFLVARYHDRHVADA